MLKLYKSFSEILGNTYLILHKYYVLSIVSIVVLNSTRHHNEHSDYIEVAEIIQCITSALSDFLSDLQ